MSSYVEQHLDDLIIPHTLPTQTQMNGLYTLGLMEKHVSVLVLCEVCRYEFQDGLTAQTFPKSLRLLCIVVYIFW